MRIGTGFTMLVLLAGSAILAPAAFRLAGVQTDRPQLGSSRNRSGYQVRINISPLIAARSANLAQFRIQIGITSEETADRNAAALWAFYE